MASNFSHSSKAPLREDKKIIIQNWHNVNKEFRKFHKIRINGRRIRAFNKNIVNISFSFIQANVYCIHYCTSAKKETQYIL
ncbi:hypothetical protein PIROE2DRAFT_18936 [Piromyces sp. E2]|nr:hypothetical protein PIROE2DRAFT_18936 [Piromyces sp. E2]|eukprot:OUM56460.1 hypothetical protein PIROE2DRAFT_18936 [Piromyces sp. E2]